MADLGARAAEIEKFDQARLWLGDMLARADFVAPYELFAGILARPTINGESGRKAMISRLGAEAEDPLDEFLNLALDYEHSETPSLQGFLHWVAAEETEVKRDLEQSDRDEVRVMTVHGAKASKRRSWLWPTRSPHPATAHRAARPFAGRKTAFRCGRPDDHSNVASQKTPGKARHASNKKSTIGSCMSR